MTTNLSKLKATITQTTLSTVLEAVRLAGGVLREGSNGPNIKVLQQALRRAGHELVVDGDYGGITRAAVERFQAASRVAADGMVGPITATYLDAVKSVPTLPSVPMPSVLKTAPWLARMRAITGTKEIPGAKSNPIILSWKAELIGRYPVLRPNLDWYVNDDTPWCGYGCGYAVGCCDPGYMPPLQLLRALAWADWGQELKVPVQGAIAVKARKGGGHVTLVEGQSKDGRTLYCRGANQHDMINVAEYPTAAFKTFRWPTGAVLPAMKPNITTIAQLGNVAKNVTEA